MTAYQVQVKPEDKSKAVKTRAIQVDLEGKKVEDKTEAFCPLLLNQCVQERCKLWFVRKGGFEEGDCVFLVIARRV